MQGSQFSSFFGRAAVRDGRRLRWVPLATLSVKQGLVPIPVGTSTGLPGQTSISETVYNMLWRTQLFFPMDSKKGKTLLSSQKEEKPYAPYTKFTGKMFLEVILFPSSTCLAKCIWISSLAHGVVLETSRLVSLFWLLNYSTPDCHLGCFSGFILFLSVATFVSEFQKTVIIIYRRSWFTDFFSI